MRLKYIPPTIKSKQLKVRLWLLQSYPQDEVMNVYKNEGPISGQNAL